MSVREPILFIEINNTEFKFIIGNFNENANLKLVHTIEIPLQGINDKKISDLKLVSDIIKDNVYLIEQKINFVFKEVIFEISFRIISFPNLKFCSNLRELFSK